MCHVILADGWCSACFFPSLKASCLGNHSSESYGLEQVSEDCNVETLRSEAHSWQSQTASLERAMQRYSALEVRHARGILAKRPDACRLLRHHYDAREGGLVMQCLSSKSTSTCLETTARSAIPYFPWLTPASAGFNTTHPHRLHTPLL